MRIIHTADWHLGHRLGRLDRSDDIHAAIDRIAGICLAEKADVLLICGDLFDDVSRADVLRASVDHMASSLAPFFEAGGTVLAITGNHDKEHLAHVLQQAMKLAAPAQTRAGDLLRPGRFYFFTGPTFFRLPDANGLEVQFVMMPWPTPTRYLDEQGQRFSSAEERHRALKAAFGQKLSDALNSGHFNAGLQTVLAAHITTSGAQVRGALLLNETDALIVNDTDLPTGLAYVALGDIHKPQCLMGLSHVRYAGSIERLDLGESEDDKGVVLVEIDAGGRRGEPRVIPLDVTPIRRVVIDDPSSQMEGLAEKHPDRAKALVHLQILYEPGRDNLPEILAKLDAVFPRWYARDFRKAGVPIEAPAPATDAAGFRQTVREYLAEQLAAHEERDALMELAESLMAEALDQQE